MKGSNKQYQMVVVFNPKIENQEKVLDKLCALLEGQGIEVSKKEHVGIKELVYEINGNSKGDFWVMDLNSGKPLNVKEINLFLNRETSIIRYLILKK